MILMVSPNTKIFLSKLNRDIKSGSITKARARRMIQGKRASIKSKKNIASKELSLIDSFSKRAFKKKRNVLTLV